MKDFREKIGFLFGETTEDKVGVANFAAELVITGTKAKSWKISSTEILLHGFESIISSTTSPFAEAELAKLKIKVITDDIDLIERYFVKTGAFFGG